MAISIKLATLRAAILRDFQIWTTSSRQQVLNIIVNASNGLSAKLWPEIYLHEVAKWVCRAVSQASRVRMRKLILMCWLRVSVFGSVSVFLLFVYRIRSVFAGR